MSLRFEDIRFAYRPGVPVLDGITAEARPGRITALLGTNGCGKTTLLRILVGILPIQQGSIAVDGQSIKPHQSRPHRARVGYMPEWLHMYADLSAAENLKYLASLRGLTGDAVVGSTLDQVGLGPHRDKPVRAMSKGMKQRLNLAQALIGNPRLVVFDEPSNGFDRLGVEMFYTTMRKLANGGAIVLLSSHQLAEIQTGVDDLILIRNGRVAETGTVDAVVQRYERQKPTRIYLSATPSATAAAAIHGCAPGAEISGSALRAPLTGPALEKLMATLREHNLHVTHINISSVDLDTLFEDAA